MSRSETSSEAYFEERTRGRLDEVRATIVAALLKYGPMDTHQIAGVTKIRYATVTPRMKELEDRDLVERAGFTRAQMSRKRVIRWRATGRPEQPPKPIPSVSISRKLRRRLWRITNLAEKILVMGETTKKLQALSRLLTNSEVMRWRKAMDAADRMG